MYLQDEQQLIAIPSAHASFSSMQEDTKLVAPKAKKSLRHQFWSVLTIACVSRLFLKFL